MEKPNAFENQRVVKISTGFERNVSIGYQNWKFPCHYEESVIVSSFEEVVDARNQFRLRAVAAVYTDILSSFDQMTAALREVGGATGPLLALKEEATKGLAKAIATLEEMAKPK